MNTIRVTTALTLAIAVTPCFAKTKHAPLPDRVLTAKVVYIENHGPAEVADRAYDELKQWGRFELVSDRSKADLVLAFSVDEGRSSSGRTAVYDPTPAPGMGGAGSQFGVKLLLFGSLLNRRIDTNRVAA